MQFVQERRVSPRGEYGGAPTTLQEFFNPRSKQWPPRPPPKNEAPSIEK